MTISAQQVRDAAGKIAGRLAASASVSEAGDHCAVVSEVLFLGEFDRLVSRLESAPVQIPEKPPAVDPNAAREALAAEIVASANLAARPPVSSAKTEAEALADEIIASAAPAGGRLDA
jgi:hypothetical protein